MKKTFGKFAAAVLSLTILLLGGAPLPAFAAERGLNAEEEALVSLAAEDLDAANRYYRENLIVPGIYGTRFLDAEELSRLTGKTLLSVEKTEGSQAEGQFFRLYVYTDMGEKYVVRFSAAARSVYTAAELLKDVPEDETILFAVFHFQSYEYEDQRVALRFYEAADPFTVIGGKQYFVRSDGSLAASGTTINGVRYRFDKAGVCQGTYTGFTTSKKGRRYWRDGVLVKNKWIRVGGERKYYAGADGYFVTGTRVIGGTEYTFAENGALRGA